VTPTALRQLMQLAEARKARDLARLDRLLVEDRRLAAEVAELAGTAARDLAEDVALPLAQQGLRLAWADQRIRAAERRRAELAAGIGAARAEAAQSLGKHRALEHLVERAERAALQVRAARAEREAPPAGGSEGA
jgi:hypothetical protein